MASSSRSIMFYGLLIGLALGIALPGRTFAQSTEISFPTAITENQLSGRIKARDIGDPRLTTFYYTFNADQGDLFVNVVTKNLSGSIDVFDADDMRSLTKILVYADLGDSETGRVIYLRKPEKLILRIEGRTPNDDPADFQVKFAGGFEAAVPTKNEPPVPKVTDLGTNDSGIKVNSAGTIVAVIPKASPTPSPDTDSLAADEKSVEPMLKPEPNQVSKTRSLETEEAATKTKKPKATRAPKATVRKAEGKGTLLKSAPIRVEKDEPPPPPPPRRKPPKVIVTDNTATSEVVAVNPLANVRLVILFKDGRKVERPMTEVLRFTADQTTLTVVSTNGRIVRFPILDVASVSIQ
jgi:hypothetical protein